MERTNFGMLLAKIEGTYGTDPTPTAAANLIAISRAGFSYAPKFDHLVRQLLDGTISKVSGLNAMPEVALNFDLEIRGNRTNGSTADISAGASGQAIEIDPLLQACDLAPTYTAETTGGARDGNVIYKPTVPTDEGKSVTFYFYSGLKVHKILGAKGTVKGTLQAGQFGKLTFNFMGLYVSVTDASIPGSPSWLNTKPPIFINSGSTIDSYSPVFQKIDFDLGAKVQRRDDANATSGVRGFMIVDRDSKCSIDPESVAEGTNPVWADLEGGVARTVTGKVGTQTGNKFQATFAAVSAAAAYADRSNIRTQQIDYSIERANISDTAGAEFQFKFQ